MRKFWRREPELADPGSVRCGPCDITEVGLSVGQSHVHLTWIEAADLANNLIVVASMLASVVDTEQEVWDRVVQEQRERSTARWHAWVQQNTTTDE